MLSYAGTYTLSVQPRYGSTRVGQIEFPVLPLTLDAHFRRIAAPFYEVSALCAVDAVAARGSLPLCAQTTWSSFYPDAKAQIDHGFDEVANSLY